MGKKVFLVGLVLLLAGCDTGSSVLNEGLSFVAQWIGADKKVAAIPSPSPSGGDEFSSLSAKNAKANAEILHEIFQVVFMHEPENHAEFGNWVDTLNQGASLEGVYNGLTHSSSYRQLEEEKQGASAEAVRVF